MKKIIAAAIATCTMFAMVGTAFAGEAATRPEASAHKMADFNLDGNLDEWNIDSPLTIVDSSQLVRDALFWTGPDDLSATFYVSWDEEYFYLAANIVDDTNNGLGVIEMLPIDGEDNIEIFISTNPADDPDRTEYNTNDFLLYINNDEDDSFNAVDRSMIPKDKRMRFTSAGKNGYESVIEGYEWAKQLTTVGYTFECRIPWEYFSNENIEVYTPQVGDTINFDVLVTDIGYPCPGTEFIPQMAWAGTSSELLCTNPSEWGRLTFVE